MNILNKIYRKAFSLSESTYITTVIFSFLLVVANVVLINRMEWMDEIEVEVYQNLRYLLYNLTFHLLALALSVVFFKMSANYSRVVKVAAALIPLFFIYEILSIFLDAFTGEGSSIYIGLRIIIITLAFVITATIMVDRYINSLISKNKFFQNFFRGIKEDLDVTVEATERVHVNNKYHRGVNKHGIDSLRAYAPGSPEVPFEDEMSETAYDEIRHWMERNRLVSQVEREDIEKLLGKLNVVVEKMKDIEEMNTKKPGH